MIHELDLIAFDADDTLWHTESLYVGVQDRFKEMLTAYHSPEWIEQKLYETEMHNLQFYGYGIKAFALSLIETAIELTEGRITGQEIRRVIELAKEMLRAEVHLMDHAAETIKALSEDYPLMIITKGDLLDQESKIERSGLKPHFCSVEIVSEKTSQSYAALLARHQVPPDRFLMVGNSLRSDILPVVDLGGHAVHIPAPFTWVHEHVTPSEEQRSRYVELEHLGQLPAWIDSQFRAGREP